MDKESENKALIGRFIELRKKYGPTQMKFGKLLGLSDGTISTIEAGSRPINERHIRLICGTLGINEAWFRKGTGPMFTPPPPEPPAPVIIDGRTLEPEERELLDIYDKLIPETQREIRDYANEKLELQELREIAASNREGEAPEGSKQAPGGTTQAPEAPQGAKPALDTEKGESPGIGPNPKNGETG